MTSTLGGERREVRCPWCEGSGRFQSGHDAQEVGPVDPLGADSASPSDTQRADPARPADPRGAASGNPQGTDGPDPQP